MSPTSDAPDATTDAVADTTAPTPDAASIAIGPSGGSVSVDGASINVPAGALTSAVTISITRDSSTPPGGYVALSALYHFAPDGLTFAVPATVTFAVDSANPRAQIQWSNPTGGGYSALPTSWTGNRASAQVSHFSAGFVGFADDADADIDAGTILSPSNLASDTCDTLATSDLHVTASQTIDTGVDTNCDLIVTGSPDICVIRRNVITVDANVTLTGVGTRALALVGTTSVTINGVVDVSAVLSQNGAGTPDPRGQGGDTSDVTMSGAGGGYGTFGGAAGDSTGPCTAGCAGPTPLPDGGPSLFGLPGPAYGTQDCIPLVGGAAGSSAHDDTADGGIGGGAGGAVEIVSCGALIVGPQGMILAGGGGGLGGIGGTGARSGGGGGSGGTVLLEGNSVSLGAGATVIGNGGGGGSGGGQSGMTVFMDVPGNAGADGSKSAGPAPGGTQSIPLAHAPGSPGASGGAEGVAPNSGNSFIAGGGGGAGGAVGRVRINVPAGQTPSIAGAIFSPLFTSGATTMH